MTPYTGDELLELLKTACRTKYAKTFTAAPDVVAFLMTRPETPDEAQRRTWDDPVAASLYALLAVPVIADDTMPERRFRLVTHNSCIVVGNDVDHGCCGFTEGEWTP